MPPSFARSLIILEFAICFAPVLGFLAFGLVSLPLQLVVLVMNPFSIDALVPAAMLLGICGVFGLYELLGWILCGRSGTIARRTLYFCLGAGVVALLPIAILFAPELRLFSILAVLATGHFVWLGRDYRQRC